MNLKGMISQMQMGMPGESGPSGQAQPPEAVAPASKAPGDAGHHLSKALAAHKAGDHKKAKHHAFKAINAMPAAAPSAPSVPPAAPAAV